MTAKKGTAPAQTEAKETKTTTAKKETGTVTVKILQGTIHGAKPGSIIEIDADLAKAYGPEYVKVVKKGEKADEEEETAE